MPRLRVVDGLSQSAAAPRSGGVYGRTGRVDVGVCDGSAALVGLVGKCKLVGWFD